MIAAAALALALAVPLDCPPGATPRGAAPPEDFALACEGKDDAGRPRKHGPARTWYDDGGRWTEASYTQGELDGPFVEYHRNGRKAREGRYLAGRKDGPWITWYESGAVEETATWKAGVLQGPFASFRPDGSRKAEGRHCGGAQCGRWTTFGEDGRVVGTADFGEWSSAP